MKSFVDRNCHAAGSVAIALGGAFRPCCLQQWLAVLAVAALILVLTPAAVGAQALPAGGALPRLLVVPFEEKNREPRAYWLGEGSAVILTDDLLSLGAPAITRDDRLRAFDRLNVPSAARLSYATVIRLGQIVGAAQVVVGSYEMGSAELTVRARTIQLDTGRMGPEIAEQGPLGDIFGIYARVARRILPGSRVTAEQMEEGHPPIAAFEQYIKGVLAEAPATKVSFLTQALMIAPTFQRARIALWGARTEESDHQRALVAVRQVPANHRLFRKARFLTTISLIHLAQYQEAFDLLTELNRAEPDPALLNNLGVVQLRRPLGAPGGRAVVYFAEAAKLDDGDADLFFNLGYAFWLDRDMLPAVEWLREAVRRRPNDHEAHYILGAALQTTGSVAEGAREKELARRLSSVIDTWEAKQSGGIAVPRGLERLKTDIDVAASLRVESRIEAAGQREQREMAIFHLEAGRRLFQAERDVEAVAALSRAVYLAPYDSEAHLLLARIHMRGGRVAEAIDALKISLWSEDTIAARLALAEAYILAKDDAAARSELQAIIRRDPPNADARRLLGRIP